MSVKNDQVNVKVTIDGKQAINTLGKLEMDALDIKKALTGMTKGTEEYIKKSKELDQVNKKIADLRQQIGLTGMTMQQLRNYQRELNKEINNTATAGTPRYEQLKKKLAEVNSVISKQQQAVRGVNSEFQKGTGIMTSFLGTFLAGMAQQALSFIINFGKESFKAFQESKAANAQLQASLQSTAGAAGLTFEEIDKLAGKLQDLTNIDDDIVKSSASLLLTFTNIKKGVFEEALPAITDLAAKMASDSGGEIDLKSATIQVGKALNDPIKGMSALSKVGVSFTAQQKKVVEEMMKTGDVAGAQRIILEELNKEFAGSAKAAAEAQGPMGKFNVAVAERQEQLGEFLDNAGSPFIDFFTDFINSLDPILEVFGELGDAFGDLFSEIGGLAGDLGLVNEEMSAGEAAASGFATGLRIILTPIKWIVQGLGWVIDKFRDLVMAGKFALEFFDSFSRIMDKFWSQMFSGNFDFTELSKEIAKESEILGKKMMELVKEKIERDKPVEIPVDVQNPTNKVNKIEQELTDAQVAELERRRKEWEKKYKELAKDWEKFNEDILNFREQFSVKQLSKDQQDLANISDKYDKEIALMREKEEELIRAKVTTREEFNAKIAELERLRDEELRNKRIEQTNKRLEDEEKAYQDLTNKIFEATATSEEQQLMQVRTHYDELIRQAQEYGLSTEALEQARNLKIKEIQDKANQESLAEQERVYAAKIGLANNFNTLAGATAQFLNDLGVENSQAAQALALTQIAIDTGVALSATIAGATKAAAAGGPAAPFLLLGYITTGIATVLTAFGRAKKAISGAPKPEKATIPTAPQGQPAAFAKGGSTGSVSGGGVVPGFRFATFGEKGPEYVVPNWMMKNPAIANIVGMMEAVRVRGFADGGSTIPTAGGSSSPVASTPSDLSAAIMAPLIDEMRLMRAELKNMKLRIRAYMVYSDFEDARDTIDDIRNDASA